MTVGTSSPGKRSLYTSIVVLVMASLLVPWIPINKGPVVAPRFTISSLSFEPLTSLHSDENGPGFLSDDETNKREEPWRSWVSTISCSVRISQTGLKNRVSP